MVLCRILTTDMCCEIFIVIIALVAAARRNRARKNQEVAQEMITKDTASETTLSPRSTNDSDTTRGLSEKSPKSAAPDAEKPCWSFCHPWRKFKRAKPCLEC